MGCFPSRDTTTKAEVTQADEEVSLRFLSSKTLRKTVKINTQAELLLNLSRFLIKPNINTSHKYQISSETHGFGHFGVNSQIKKGFIKDSQVPILAETVKLTEITEKTQEILNDFFANLDEINALSHPNLLKILDIFEDQGNLVFIYEDFAGSDLYDKICELG